MEANPNTHREFDFANEENWEEADLKEYAGTLDQKINEKFIGGRRKENLEAQRRYVKFEQDMLAGKPFDQMREEAMRQEVELVVPDDAAELEADVPELADSSAS
jgi:hypothetical protein